MRCHQARIKLDVGGNFDRELTEHLENCPECARYARANDVLIDSFNSIRADRKEESTPIAVVRAKLAALHESKEHSTMANLTNAIKSHPRLGLGVTIGFLALLFLILVPLPYQRVAGYNLQIGGINPDVSIQELTKAIGTLGYSNFNLKAEAGSYNISLKFENLSDLKAARGIAAAVRKLTGTADSPVITPKFETVSASLYAQAREKMVKIEVDGTGKTDEQIKAEIEAKLAAQGFDKPLVYIKNDGNGKRQIQMELKTVGDAADSGAPQQSTIEIDTKGKTDDQIRQEVQNGLAAQGHPNADVGVNTTGSDSTKERKIEIQIQNDDGN